ncbi:MAG: GAF domain-containing protein [Anaerolineales bacterium]|nr:GAF domain-containing protein [Anaerolineales bacterium]
MQPVLLISANGVLEQEIESALQGSVDLTCVATLTEAELQLQTNSNHQKPIVLVVLDAIEQAHPAIMCEEAIRAIQPHSNRLVVLIDNPDERQAVLEAGASDYLLKPFAHTEVRAKLLLHLNYLELSWMNTDAQIQSAQNSLLTLLFRIINSQTDLNAILAQTLEQTAALLDAWAAELWLVTPAADGLELVSSVSQAFSARGITKRRMGEGLIGWLAEQEKPVVLDVSPNDTRFDPQVDLLNNQDHYSVLGVALKHQAHSVGVLAVYSHSSQTFTAQDIDLVKGISNLVASAIANARAMQDIQQRSACQSVLYEMSLQIADGLDLQTTINRSLQWINRLCEVDASLLWLVDEKSQEFRVVSVLGATIEPHRQAEFALGSHFFVSESSGERAIVNNDPTGETAAYLAVFERLGVKRRSFLAINIQHRRQTIGMIALLNKIGGPFSETETDLLCTAAEMIGISVSNAWLHERTLKLIQQSERMHKLALQNERLATIGRLTASLAHEINNPMQAVRGALNLAQEELNNPQELNEYLNICLVEVDRVVSLVQRIRQIYQPATDHPRPVSVPQIIQEALADARKEMVRKEIKVQLEVPSKIEKISGIANQLHLAFLCVLLRVSDGMGDAGGGDLLVRVVKQDQNAAVEFKMRADKANWAGINPDEEHRSGEQVSLNDLLGLSLAHDIIVAHDGSMSVALCDQQTCLKIVLPCQSSIE